MENITLVVKSTHKKLLISLFKNIYKNLIYIFFIYPESIYLFFSVLENDVLESMQKALFFQKLHQFLNIAKIKKKKLRLFFF